jgi:hypothetical protein
MRPSATSADRLALAGFARPRSRSDGSRLEGGKERKEEQRSDSKRKEAENLLHFGSYAFSSWCRGGASVETACVSGASGLS